MKPLIATCLGLMTLGLASFGLHAQAPKLNPTRVYTAEQAARGAAFYQSKCSLCHGADLSGDGTAPPLAGADFLSHWAGQPVVELFEKIHTSMPSDQPGTLTAQQAVDLVAFLLSSNKLPAGQSELPAATDQLKLIVAD